MDCLLGFRVSQGARDEWFIDRLKGRLVKWGIRGISLLGRLVVFKHIICGMLNFYLELWSMSKEELRRVN